MKAAVLQQTLTVDPALCNGCGRCAGKCPFGAVTHPQNGYRIFIGGRWGKKGERGIPLSKLFTSEEEVLDTVEKILCFYRDEGIAGERFAETIQRIGFRTVEEKILHD